MARPASEARNSGSMARIRRQLAVRFTSSSFCHSFGSMWVMGAKVPSRAALPTSTSNLPKRSKSAAPILSRVSKSAMSHGTNVALPPMARISSSSSSSAPWVRAVKMT